MKGCVQSEARYKEASKAEYRQTQSGPKHRKKGSDFCLTNLSSEYCLSFNRTAMLLCLPM